ncbi:MAG: hypothetical protein ACYC61_15000 [Isosphaeraceae bacterium]
MNRSVGRLWTWRTACLVAGLVLVSAIPARAQLTTQDEERLRILADPDAPKKKAEEKKLKPPFEFFKSQVAPFDVLPFVKAHHWSTLTLEMRANEGDYDGLLQTDPLPMAPMPLEMVFRREARLVKEQTRALGQQVLVNRVPKEWTLTLLRPNSLRGDASWQAILTSLEPHQSLILVLSKDSTNQFASWGRMSALIPARTDREAIQQLDRERYYRLVLPTEPDKLALSPHPLTWSTISHVVWDALPPDSLSVGQQQALLDWLHWGGQLIFTGGASQAYALYRESFLGPYLPGEPTGQMTALDEADLQPLSHSYPPPVINSMLEPSGRRYLAAASLRPATKKPVYLSVLRPAEGASTIPLGEGSTHLLAIERRVGRGRITMLTINPTEPTFALWSGLDTMVRRVILRRPEEGYQRPPGSRPTPQAQGPTTAFLNPSDLTWYRITSRDALPGDDQGPLPQAMRTPPPAVNKDPGDPDLPSLATEDEAVSLTGVADWRDTARFPVLARELLEQASGLTIPSSMFVLKVILAYLMAIVPINWLVCRVVLRRREWAWVVVPVVSIIFAYAVQRGAAYDMGFDSAMDEIDLLELQGGYPRGHLSRFASVYTTGHGSFTISYPSNNTALALPMSSGREIPGEDITISAWQSVPVPTLSNFSVQPRSLSLLRAEEMTTLPGSIRLEGDGAGRRVVNATDLELRDATLIDNSGPRDEDRKERYLGTIAPGGVVELEKTTTRPFPERIVAESGPDPDTILRVVRSTWEPRDENQGEIRLVAWVPQPMPGQAIDPPTDRTRGYTAILVHLRNGPPPSPDGPHYNLAREPVRVGPGSQAAGGPQRTSRARTARPKQ